MKGSDAITEMTIVHQFRLCVQFWNIKLGVIREKYKKRVYLELCTTMLQPLAIISLIILLVFILYLFRLYYIGWIKYSNVSIA